MTAMAGVGLRIPGRSVAACPFGESRITGVAFSTSPIASLRGLCYVKLSPSRATSLCKGNLTKAHVATGIGVKYHGSRAAVGNVASLWGGTFRTLRAYAFNARGTIDATLHFE